MEDVICLDTIKLQETALIKGCDHAYRFLPSLFLALAFTPSTTCLRLEEISNGVDDEELQQARNNLRLKKTTSKRNGINGVVEALRKLHRVTFGEIKVCNEDSEPFDPENDASNDDDYESEAQEYEKPKRINGEYIVDEGSCTEFGWGSGRRPTTSSEWFA
ncbi:hypothetical protein ACFE04_018486 [Oxalis oulophora]